MAWLDSRTITISLSLFFLPVLLLCIVLSLPILVFLICTLYVTAWLIYLITAQTDHSFNLPYNPIRIVKVNYAAASMIWGTLQSIPLAISVLYWRYVVAGGRAAAGELRFEEFARCNIPYTTSDHPSQTLDLYLPTPPTSKEIDGTSTPARAYPIIIFIYGGSWSSGSKSLYVGLANNLREMGYIVVVPDYRRYPEVKVGEMYKDVATVIEWTYQNVAREEIGGDGEHIYLMGHSAGAHLASHVVLQDVIHKAHKYELENRARQQENGVVANANANANTNTNANAGIEKSINGDVDGVHPLPRVEGLILCAGVFDIKEHYKWETGRGVEKISAMSRAMGQSTSSYTQNSPYHLVTSSPDIFATSPVLLPILPRILFIHGERDATVPVSSTLEMYNALGVVIPVDRRDEVDIRMRLYKRMDHVECVTALMPNYLFPSRFRRPLMRDLQDFIDFES